MKKKALIALLLFVLLVGGVSIITSVNQSKARNALADYKAKLRAQGEKLTFVELGCPFPLETNANLENFSALVDRLQGKSQIPGAGYVEPIQYESPGRALVIWAGGSMATTNSSYIPTWEQLSTDMQAAAELLAELRAELEHPPSYVGYDYTNYAPTNWPSKLFVHKRKAAQFLAADSIAALHEHELARAQTDLHALTQLTQVHRDDITLVSAMIRVAIANLGLNVTWQSLQAEGWDEAALARLQRDWEAVDLIAGLEKGFAGERAFGQKGFAVFHGTNVGLQDDYLSGLSLGFSSSKSGFARLKEQLSAKAAFAYWRGHMEEDEMFYLHDSQARLEIIRRFKTNTSAASLQIEIKAQHDALEKEFDKPLGKYRHLFSAVAIPNFSRAFEVAIQRETERRMTITAIVLKRFHLRNGHHPAALAELAPQFLAAELMDPWGGRPFHYYSNADGTFTLYSVGEDGRDDGGDPTSAKSTNAPPDMWTGKDTVWPTPVFPTPP